ncbi:MAG: L-seryl-tRNA(Sec) selenium transferase [Candidatus Eisenbacteria bacterium]|uniref:L-seryl-tRNA(Sec) selenium transferase n=1 Tax=Eiseniibacteriota bacterium TaxID=2212470 RepID=A0A933W9V8_UNCEI|nr:L-seryl-tRNA(Sec) selenium transferase [Candidatus Eisenbacteria bacterium]
MPKPASRSLRALPAVETLLQHEVLAAVLRDLPRTFAVGAARAVIAEARAVLAKSRTGAAPAVEALAEAAAARAWRDATPQLRRVLNATGIVLHTNLGRAPLPEAARRAVAEVAAGYSSLEFDLGTGRRGDRGAGVERQLARLTGAEAAAVVNNGAAAVLLALSALAAGRKVLVSRGELVEIGGAFRVPEIMEKSGATLVEVGATNRTHLRDYKKALERHDGVAAILRVHPSNFRIEGFTARPSLNELATLARAHRLPLIEDLGSGALVDLAEFGLEHEPTVSESLAAGASVVTCSGDKLLGGAQAGLVLGGKAWLAKIRKDPFARAMRADKLALAALEATLLLYADPERAKTDIPVLAALHVSERALAERAERLAHEIAARVEGVGTKLGKGAGEVGGGSLPRTLLHGPVVEVTHPKLSAAELERRARAASPPVIGTVKANKVRLDPRTLSESEVGIAATALAKAWNA